MFPRLDHLLVERPNFAFVADVEYEWLPPFYSHCKMIGHKLAQCRVIHDQGHLHGPQHKPFKKTTLDEREQGRVAVPKQHKEYRKKDPQPKIVEGPIDKLTIDAPGKANAELLLDYLASDKTDGGKNDFVDMPPLEDASDHDRSSPRQGLFTPTSDISEPGMVRNSPIVMQAKGSESELVVHSVTTPTVDHHVEVYAPVVVPSPSRPTSPWRAKSPGDTKATIKITIDGHHVEVSAIVTVPSPSHHTYPRKAKYLGDVKTLVLVMIHWSYKINFPLLMVWKL